MERAVAWLEVFVRSAPGTQSLLNEHHKVFEKTPELRSGSRERIEAALSAAHVPGQGRRGRTKGSGPSRLSAAIGLDGS